MNINDLNEVTSSTALGTKLRDYAIEYLIDSGFVENLVKKTIFNSDIDDFYDDFLQETYLAILEQKNEKWIQLYNSSIEKKVDFEYEIRNYVSRIILNTCRSTSSNAYRKLKKPSTREIIQDNVKWDVMRNQLVEPKSVEAQITELNYD